jgi:ABC-type lipoprotein export system ATPase subunit
MGVAAARAHELVKTFGSGRAATRVLDGASLEVADGEIVAVLGGLDRPDSGTIEVAGVRVDGQSERVLTTLRRRHVGFVFQAFHLLPELTGMENVLLPARFARHRQRALPRVRALVESLGLADAAGRLPATMSGGEQQRLAIARALVNDPQLVLADEPTGNLDADSARTVLDLLRRVADRGQAIVLVTHDRDAAAIADRVLQLRGGRLAA